MKVKILSLAAAIALVFGMSSMAKADSFDWTLAPGLTASTDYNASGGTFTLTFTITNTSGTSAGIYDFSLSMTGGSGSISTTSASGPGGTGAFEWFDDTKQNNGSGNTCNTTTNSGWLCVDYSGGYATIASGGSATWTFTGTYTGDPVDIQHLMAQGCVDTSQTYQVKIDGTHPPQYQTFNCPFNGAGSYNISLDGTGTNVPEPSSLVLLGAGLVGMAGFMRRKMMA